MSRPPAFAERLLGWTLSDDDRDVVLGDLAEEFSSVAVEHGVRAARRWYWRQLRRSAASNVRGRWDRSHTTRASPLGASQSRFRFSPGAIMRDIRDALRALRAAPNFTAVALIVLTLGIGASTAIYSVVDAVVLRDLPLRRSDQLMVVAQVRTDRNQQPLSIAPQDYADWTAQQTVFDGLAAWTGGGTLTMQDGEPESLKAVRATASLFAVLQAVPQLGATFSATNENAGRITSP